jgi:hypothetical protein
MTGDVCRRALDQVDRIAGYIRDPRARERFFKRPPVQRIVDHALRFTGPVDSMTLSEGMPIPRDR